MTILGMLLALTTCGLIPSPPVPTIAMPTTPATLEVASLSSGIGGADQFPIFSATIPAEYGSAFALVIRTLKSHGDEIEQADADRGFIVTAETRHKEAFLAAVYTTYFVVLMPVTNSTTTMTFRVCTFYLGDSLFREESDRAPYGSDVYYPFAARLAQAVHLGGRQ
jgi:hypothetical protein